MSESHSLLAAAWTTGDTTPLLVLADLLDERADHDTAELLRQITADGRTARNDRDRDRRLRQLRDGIWKRIKPTGWPDMAAQGSGGAANFSRRPDPSRPDREHIIVRPNRGTLHWLRVELDREDEVVRDCGRVELLRRRLLPEALDFVRRRGDLSVGAGFSAIHDFFPFPNGWQADPSAAEAEQLRQFEAAIGSALLPVTELPAELIPFVAWLLAEYLADRPRRARLGEPVPGAHLFVFRDGRWRHAASLDPRDTGRAAGLLRRRVRWERNRGVVAGLLVRVADDGRITARKLVWFGPGGEQESANLKGVAATLPTAEFRRASDELGADEAALILDDHARLLRLFAGG